MERYFVDGKTILHIQRADRRSNTGHTGIHYIAKSNTHQVRIGARILGWRVRLEDALTLRAEGLRQLQTGTFDSWYAELKTQRRTYKK